MNPLAPYLNRVTHGDCLELLRQLPDACIDFALTDPPYLVRYQDRRGRTVPNDDNRRWLFPAFYEIARVLKPDRFCASFYSWTHADRFLNVWREVALHPIGHFVFTKRYASKASFTGMFHEQAYLLAKGYPAKPDHPPEDLIRWEYSGNGLHPTQKPVKSLLPLVEAYSSPGHIILDPFGGSGTTAIAARQLGRQFIVMEKDRQYAEAAQRRLKFPP